MKRTRHRVNKAARDRLFAEMKKRGQIELLDRQLFALLQKRQKAKGANNLLRLNEIAQELSSAVMAALDPHAPDHEPRKRELAKAISQAATAVEMLRNAQVALNGLGSGQDAEIRILLPTDAYQLPEVVHVRDCIASALSAFSKIPSMQRPRGTGVLAVTHSMRVFASMLEDVGSGGGPRVDRRRAEFGASLASAYYRATGKKPAIRNVPIPNHPEARDTLGGSYVSFVQAVLKVSKLTSVYGWSAKHLAQVSASRFDFVAGSNTVVR